VIYLVEEFYSIQGEGLYSGRPSIFLRFGGCNLTCRGFQKEYQVGEELRVGCDSYYSVDRAFSGEWSELHTVDDFKEILSCYSGVKHIVITGGEPLIYINQELFLKALELFKRLGYVVTVETNGTIPIDSSPIWKELFFSISPKLSNSLEPFKSRLNLNALHSIISNSNHHIFKFTIDRASIEMDIEREIELFQREFPDSEIFLMPLGEDRESLELNSDAVATLSLKGRYNYSDRLHIRLWNRERGV
jgi:organic radical activating enzyme